MKIIFRYYTFYVQCGWDSGLGVGAQRISGVNINYPFILGQICGLDLRKGLSDFYHMNQQ